MGAPVLPALSPRWTLLVVGCHRAGLVALRAACMALGPVVLLMALIAAQIVAECVAVLRLVLT